MSSQRRSLLCLYRYDPLDRLINQARPDAPVYQRFYCKSRLATEIQGAIQHSIIQHGDLLLAQQQRDGDEISATLLATDPQRSVLYTLGTNNPRQSIAYNPYGHRRAESGLTSLLGFNGERRDPVTGHYLLGNGYRAFNPVLMRFNTPDSLSPFGKGGLNSFAYCLGNPVNSSDPTGHVALLANLPNRIAAGRSVSLQALGGSSLPFIVRPGVLEAHATKALIEMDRLQHHGSDQLAQSNAYLEHLNTARTNAFRDSNANLTLEKMAIKRINNLESTHSTSELTDSLPPRLKEISTHIAPRNERLILLEYIKAGRHGVYDGDLGHFSLTKLRSARNGEYHPSTPPSLQPNPEAAKQYWSEIYSVRNPRRDSLEAKVRNIRDIYFD